MSYNSEAAGYAGIGDALDDVLEFAFGAIVPESVTESGKNPYDFEE